MTQRNGASSSSSTFKWAKAKKAVGKKAKMGLFGSGFWHRVWRVVVVVSPSSLESRQQTTASGCSLAARTYSVDVESSGVRFEGRTATLRV